MEEVPAKILAECMRFRDVSRACPSRLPFAAAYSARGFEVGELQTVSIEAGFPHSDPRRNRPPSFAHVVVQAGELSIAFDTFEYATAGPPTAPRDGLMQSKERRALYEIGRSGRTPVALFLGAVTWNDRAGTLALVPPFEAVGSIHADHIVFRWQQDGAEYALSLHAWEPFLESMATLEEIVSSLGTPEA
jgi:hypothetical protein